MGRHDAFSGTATVRDSGSRALVKKRLDVLLVERGLAESRAQAQALVLAGLVPGLRRRRASRSTSRPSSRSSAAGTFVSRGGEKLAHALEAFGVDPAGRDALDVGASTGGFTDVLLQRGAARVIALDVGYGQLHPRLRDDPRVTVLERANARELTRAAVRAGARRLRRLVHQRAQGAAAGARAGRAGLGGAGAREAAVRGGRGEARRGVVRDREVHRRVLREVAEAALGWGAQVRRRRRLRLARPEGEPRVLPAPRPSRPAGDSR